TSWWPSAAVTILASTSLTVCPIRVVGKIRLVVGAFVGLAAFGTAQSVWDAIYTTEQATRGGLLYSERCARCHGPDLTGGETAPALASPEFKGNWSGLSVDDLFERIKISMPQENT